jgi:hypothetical protein
VRTFSQTPCLPVGQPQNLIEVWRKTCHIVGIVAKVSLARALLVVMARGLFRYPPKRV